jgi:putative acetyltransferase
MIRTGERNDQPRIQELVFDILRSYGLAPSPETTDADLYDLDSFSFNRGGDFSVLIGPDDRIIGTIALFNCGQGICELRKMYLHPSYRGKGYGKELLVFAFEKARALGFTRMELETASVLKEAIKLYESFGFRPFIPHHLSSRCDSAYYLPLDQNTDAQPVNPANVDEQPI